MQRESGTISAGVKTMLNTRKCTTIAVLGAGLAVAAATPASADYYGHGYGYSPSYGYGYKPYYGYGFGHRYGYKRYYGYRYPYYRYGLAGWPAAYGYGRWGWHRAYGSGSYPPHGYGCCRSYYGRFAYPGYYARYRYYRPSYAYAPYRFYRPAYGYAASFPRFAFLRVAHLARLARFVLW